MKGFSEIKNLSAEGGQVWRISDDRNATPFAGVSRGRFEGSRALLRILSLVGSPVWVAP